MYVNANLPTKEYEVKLSIVLMTFNLLLYFKWGLRDSFSLGNFGENSNRRTVVRDTEERLKYCQTDLSLN